MTEQPEYLTVPEAAELLRLSEHAISRMLNRGQLPGIFAGRREGWRIRRIDLATWRTNVPGANVASSATRRRTTKRPKPQPPQEPQG